MAAAYDGPHSIVLNRNEPNLGIVLHFNKIIKMSSGHFICMNAGDDFSSANRVDVLYEAWVSNNQKHDIIHSAAWKVNSQSKKLKILYPHSATAITQPSTLDFVSGTQQGIGATFMYTKRLFKIFGPLPKYAEVEDRPMVFRAYLAGGLLFANEPLVYHRVGGISSPRPETLGHMILFGGRIKTLSWRVSSAKCYLNDLKLFPNQYFGINEKQIRQFIENGEWEIKLSEASYVRKLKLFKEALVRTSSCQNLKPVRSYIKYLTWPIYYALLNIKNRNKNNETKA